MTPTAFDMPATRRLTFAAALTVAGLLAVVGCDDQPDSAALNDLGKAIDLATSGDRERSYVVGLKDLQGRQGLSESTQALVSRAAGDVDRLIAYDTLAGVTGEGEDVGQPGLLARQLEVIRLTEQLNASARDLRLLGTARAQTLAAVEAIEQGIQAMMAKATAIADEATWTPAVGEPDTGGPYAGIDGEVSDLDQQTWQIYTQRREELGSTQLTAMAGVRQELNGINDNIATSQEKLASLGEERDGLLTRAGARERDSVSAQGDEAVAAAREIADLNIEAGTLQSQMVIEQGALDELNRDKAIAEARLASLQGAADMLRSQAEAIEQSLGAANGLQTINREIGDAVTALVNGGGEGDPGMTAVAQTLAEAREDADRLRVEALDALNSAATAFENSSRLAATAASGVGRSSARPAGSVTAAAMEATGRSGALALAQTRRQIGDLKLGRASVELGLIRLGSNLQGVPDEAEIGTIEAMTDSAADAFGTALAEAVTAFDEAGDAAAGVNGGGPEVTRAAMTQRAMALSGLAAVTRLAEAASSLDSQLDVSGVPARSEVDERVATLASEAESAGVTLQPVAGIDLGTSERATPPSQPAGAGADMTEQAEPEQVEPEQVEAEQVEQPEVTDDAGGEGMGE